MGQRRAAARKRSPATIAKLEKENEERKAENARLLKRVRELELLVVVNQLEEEVLEEIVLDLIRALKGD